MNGSGIIGLLILFIVFNLVSRILQAVASQKAKKPDEALRRRALGAKVEAPEQAVFEVDIGEEPTLEGLQLEEEKERYEEAYSAEDRTSLESWLEETFERQGEIESRTQKRYSEHLESQPGEGAIARYASFERGIESEEDAEESKRKRYMARLYEHRRALEEGKPAARAMLRQIEPPSYRIRNSTDLKLAIVGAEVIGPCKARVFQYRMRNRIAREVSR